jgi:hypothetical protein
MAATKKIADAEVFAFPAFDAGKITDGYREFTEKSVAQSKEAYDKMKSAAEDATKTNSENLFSHIEALMGVKSIAEMIELQSSFLRKQVEVTVDQTRTMQETFRKVAEDVSKPGKAAVEKTVKEVQTL